MLSALKGVRDSGLGKRGSGHDLGQTPLRLPHHSRCGEVLEIKMAPLKCTIIAIMLVLSILPVSLAWGAPLPGPLPPAPPPIPTPPPDSDFDHVTVFPKTEGDVDQTKFGTPEKDKIIQWGATGNVTQYAEGGEGNDWILQVGGDKSSDQTAILGEGNDISYQYGGKGDSNQFSIGGDGNQTNIQIGGQGANHMEAAGGIGNSTIKQYGGSGPNIMKATGNSGDDVIEMYGGSGNNTMVYNVSSGNDLVTILGGGGYSALTIQKRGQNFTLQDYQGHVMFQSGSGGSTIIVANLTRIMVIGDTGKPIYTYNAGSAPTIIGPLLLGD
jgi:hypothetical protein